MTYTAKSVPESAAWQRGNQAQHFGGALNAVNTPDADTGSTAPMCSFAMAFNSSIGAIFVTTAADACHKAEFSPAFDVIFADDFEQARKGEPGIACCAGAGRPAYADLVGFSDHARRT
jgi:hypothetical protein